MSAAVWESPVRCGDFWGTFKLPATISLSETLLLLKFCLQSFIPEGLERTVNDSSAHTAIEEKQAEAFRSLSNPRLLSTLST